MTKKQFGLTLLVGMFSAFAAVGLYTLIEKDAPVETQVVQTTQPIQMANFNPPAVSGAPNVGVDFTYAAALTTPTVVHVKTTYRARQTSYRRGNSPYDIFRDFFGEEFDPYYQDEETPSYGGQASGSGVIISKDGYIVTNNHVIKDADKIEVILYNKQKVPAELIGVDPSTDLALLKLDYSEKLPYIAFGNSDSIKIGEWVLAVGNPFELASTVTAGIVSAKGRNIDILSQSSIDQPAIESFIQTDAAVNPGNSGGALVNTRGELIGINTAIATPTGTFAGYSFAVPVSIVQKVIKDLMNYGMVQRAYLGVTIDVTKEDLGGVLISDVIGGAGSAEAGLEPGDILTSINGYSVTTFPELQEQVSKYNPGDKVKVDFLRNGRDRNTMVELKNIDKSTEIIRKETLTAEELLGVDLEPLSVSEKRAFEVEKGVKVNKLFKGILGEETRISEGFIITNVNDQEIETISDITAEIKKKQGTMMIEGFYPDYPYRIYNYSLNFD